MSEAWFCEYPEHDGDRRVYAPADRFTKRETYMRADGRVRLHERSVMRVCRACIRLDTDEPATGQGALFT